MRITVSRVEMNPLPDPAGLTCEFAESLIERARAWGDGSALDTYTRQELELHAKRFAGGNPLSLAILKDWIDSLPWDQDGSITLHFRW